MGPTRRVPWVRFRSILVQLTGISIGLNCVCVGCGAERCISDDASLLMQGSIETIIREPEPCELCGERRVKITVSADESPEDNHGPRRLDQSPKYPRAVR